MTSGIKNQTERPLTRMPHSHVFPRRALTLIELLVVIAVMAVLISVLLPAIAGARGTAGSLRCQTNLRQWSLAATLYAQDNDGCLPRRGQGAQPTTNIDRPEDWFNALPPMLGEQTYSQIARAKQTPKPGSKNFWMCPNAEKSTGANYFAYGMNMWLSTWQDPNPDRIDKVGQTARMVFMADGAGAYCAVLPSNKPFSPRARHEGAINIAFLDGHVAQFSGQYVGCGTADPMRGDVSWVVPGSSWNGPSD